MATTQSWVFIYLIPQGPVIILIDLGQEFSSIQLSGKNQVFSLNPEPGVLVCELMDSAKKLHLVAEKS